MTPFVAEAQSLVSSLNPSRSACAAWNSVVSTSKACGRKPLFPFGQESEIGTASARDRRTIASEKGLRPDAVGRIPSVRIGIPSASFPSRGRACGQHRRRPRTGHDDPRCTGLGILRRALPGEHHSVWALWRIACLRPVPPSRSARVRTSRWLPIFRMWT